MAAGIDGVLMVLGTIYVVWVADNFIGPFQGFLITLGVPMAAWCGIFLGDLASRRKAYAEPDLYVASGRYGSVNLLAVVTLIVRARLQGLDESLEEAAADLGATPSRAFRQITLPLMFPDGPESVPRTPLTRTLQVESNTRATVTASRGADGAIRFRIEGERVGGPIEGSYRSGLLPPLPADFDMRGWYRAPGPGRFGEPPPGPVPAPGERLEQLR